MNYKQAADKLKSSIENLTKELASPDTPNSQHSNIIKHITVLHNEFIRIARDKLLDSSDEYKIRGGAFKNIITDYLN